MPEWAAGGGIAYITAENQCADHTTDSSDSGTLSRFSGKTGN
jgi:hypothetical protein